MLNKPFILMQEFSKSAFGGLNIFKMAVRDVVIL